MREHDYRAVGSVVLARFAVFTDGNRAGAAPVGRRSTGNGCGRGRARKLSRCRSSVVAAHCRQKSGSQFLGGEQTGEVLLPCLRDDEFPKAISRQSQPYIRGQLYLALGRTGESGTIDALRAQLHNEPDREAAQKGQVALVKLGAAAERDAFLGQVREAKPDDALRISDQLLYVGDPRLAKGLLPWFSDFHNVTRLGSDRQKSMAPMSDIAVWTAHRLGVRFQVYPEYLTNYSDSIILAARSAVDSL